MAALVMGKPYNEADWATESTMTAILGRMATYSGKVVTWDEAIKSELDLSPEDLAWDAEPREARRRRLLCLRDPRRNEGLVMSRHGA